jgi:hypothetical protein
MQPPPCPDGRKIFPAPPTLPLCFTKAPSLPMLVSEPSKIGEARKLSWYVNQFQYG